MYILDTQNIFNFAVEATGRQNLFTVKSDVVTLYPARVLEPCAFIMLSMYVERTTA